MPRKFKAYVLLLYSADIKLFGHVAINVFRHSLSSQPSDKQVVAGHLSMDSTVLPSSLIDWLPLSLRIFEAPSSM